MLAATKIETLKAEAKNLLGEEKYNTAATMTIVELNKAFAAAHEAFNDQVAEGYKNLFTVRMLGGK